MKNFKIDNENKVSHKTENYKPRNKREELLVKALTGIKTEEDAANLLRDLMTPAEIEEFANRIEIARLLLQDKSYLKVAEEIGASTTTVTRVAHWLYRGCGGYYKQLKRLKSS